MLVSSSLHQYRTAPSYAGQCPDKDSPRPRTAVAQRPDGWRRRLSARLGLGVEGGLGRRRRDPIIGAVRIPRNAAAVLEEQRRRKEHEARTERQARVD